MAKFEHPYEPEQSEPTSGCICGRHRSQLEHEHDARRLLQCVPATGEPRRYDGLLARHAMRAHFRKG
jgi:nitrate/nitrite transport system substrate-binding protein